MDIVTREYSFPSVTGLSDIYAKSWPPSEREVTAADSDFARHGGNISHDMMRLHPIYAGRVLLCLQMTMSGMVKKRKATRSWAILARKTAGRPFARDAKQVTDLARKVYPGRPIPYFWAQHGLLCRPLLYRALWQ